jgi:hypothetical protein
MDHSIRHDQQCIQSDRAARRVESGKITAGSNFDSTCCCAEAATADFVFFPQILPSDNPLKLKQLKSLRAHNFRFMLSKRLRKRFDMVVSATAVDEISPEEGGGERVTGLGARPRGFRK